MPAGREPTEDEVEAALEFLGDADWFSDYDCGISINIGGEMQRLGPGQTLVRADDGALSIEGDEVPA